MTILIWYNYLLLGLTKEKVEGAISCLAMFSSGENLQDNQLPGLIQLAFPPLLAIVNSDPSAGGKFFSDRVKMRATMVVQSCVDWFAYRNEVAHENLMNRAMGPALQDWLVTFQKVLATPDKPNQFQGFKIVVLKVSFFNIINLINQDYCQPVGQLPSHY